MIHIFERMALSSLTIIIGTCIAVRPSHSKVYNNTLFVSALVLITSLIGMIWTIPL